MSTSWRWRLQFCATSRPKPKDIQLTVTGDKKEQQKYKSEKLSPVIYMLLSCWERPAVSQVFTGWFLKPSVTSVPAHAGLAGCMLTVVVLARPGCTLLHFISFADTWKQGAAWWPGCCGSGSLQLQLSSLFTLLFWLQICNWICVSLQILHGLNCDLIFRLLHVGLVPACIWSWQWGRNVHRVIINTVEECFEIV